MESTARRMKNIPLAVSSKSGGGDVVFIRPLYQVKGHVMKGRSSYCYIVQERSPVIQETSCDFSTYVTSVTCWRVIAFANCFASGRHINVSSETHNPPQSNPQQLLKLMSAN